MANQRLIVFGTGLLAEQMHFYFSTQAGRVVDAFVLDADYLREDHFLGLPVVTPEQALQRFAPATHDMFVAIGHTATRTRQMRFEAARASGYAMPSFVHASAHVSANVCIGANSLVQELAMLAPFVQMGEDVLICPQVSINHHSRVGAHCFFAPAAVVCGDADIGQRCFLGANATVRDRVHVGADCIIGAGAVVMADCAPGGTYRAARTARAADTA